MPLGRGSVRPGGEMPVARVPGERIAVGRGLNTLQVPRRDIDQELLVERNARQRLRPNALHFRIEGALLDLLRRGDRGLEEHIEPGSGEAPVTVRRELR